MLETLLVSLSEGPSFLYVPRFYMTPMESCLVLGVEEPSPPTGLLWSPTATPVAYPSVQG